MRTRGQVVFKQGIARSPIPRNALCHGLENNVLLQITDVSSCLPVCAKGTSHPGNKCLFPLLLLLTSLRFHYFPCYLPPPLISCISLVQCIFLLCGEFFGKKYRPLPKCGSISQPHPDALVLYLSCLPGNLALTYGLSISMLFLSSPLISSYFSCSSLFLLIIRMIFCLDLVAMRSCCFFFVALSPLSSPVLCFCFFF